MFVMLTAFSMREEAKFPEEKAFEICFTIWSSNNDSVGNILTMYCYSIVIIWKMYTILR
jgi:hypothetical protein